MNSNVAPYVACHLGLASPQQAVEEVLAQHEVYLRHLGELHGAVTDGEEGLSVEEAQYLGIMAACRHKCSSLVAEQRSRFLEALGPPQWLEGLHTAPARLRCLHKANMILAHRPWMFRRAHIEELVKAGLSLAEVVHALALLAHFHSMAAMAHGLGVEAATGDTEGDFAVMEDACGGAGSSPRSSELSEGGVKVLLQRMENIAGDGSAGSGGSAAHSAASYDAAYASGLLGPEFASDSTPFDKSEDEKHRRFSIYSPNMNFLYQDFYRRGGKSVTSTLKYHNLWEEIGFSMLAKFTSHTLADAFDNKFKTAFNMTYNTCGDRNNVNTAPFRRAIWNYTQSLFGVRQDDYDYSHVNILLDRHLKVFLKTLCVAPERLASPDSCSVPAIINELRTSEQVHIVIIAAEARLQVEMVYAMLAVERYFM